MYWVLALWLMYSNTNKLKWCLFCLLSNFQYHLVWKYKRLTEEILFYQSYSGFHTWPTMKILTPQKSRDRIRKNYSYLETDIFS